MVQPATYSFAVRAAELDCRGRLTLPALADMLQEAAGRHAAQLGLSSYDLFARGLTWVLSRLKIGLSHFPGFMEEVEVRTWPCGGDRHRALRSFHVTSDGKEVAVAGSSWLVIDLAKRQAAPLPFDPDRLCAEEAVCTDFSKNIHPVRAPSCSDDLGVRWHDLDINGHVNNVNYIRWLLDALPETHLRSHVPSGLEIVFRGEALLGDRVKALAESPAPGHYLHQLVRPDGSELVRASSTWTPE